MGFPKLNIWRHEASPKDSSLATTQTDISYCEHLRIGIVTVCRVYAKRFQVIKRFSARHSLVSTKIDGRQISPFSLTS